MFFLPFSPQTDEMNNGSVIIKGGRNTPVKQEFEVD